MRLLPGLLLDPLWSTTIVVLLVSANRAETQDVVVGGIRRIS